mmetsp:Transcript_5937/g.13190  ORF Transcript_5937/g.13190 Transcript_5937/m.13190 type:complete len:237 (+) Transcript_5937:453-1163(+)
MRMHVAEPMRLSSHGVNQDWWLTRRPSLKHFGGIVPSLAPLHIHTEINLGVNSRSNQSLHRSHNRGTSELWQTIHPSKEWELHNRVANVAIVELFNEFWIKVTEDRATIGDEELSTRFGGFEADEGGGTRGTGSYELVVHSNEEVLPTLLVHGLIHRASFFPIHSRPSTHRMQRVQTSLHTQSFVELDKPLLLLHQIKFTKDDSAIVYHLLFDLHSVFFKVRQLTLGIVGSKPDIG